MKIDDNLSIGIFFFIEQHMTPIHRFTWLFILHSMFDDFGPFWYYHCCHQHFISTFTLTKYWSILNWVNFRFARIIVIVVDPTSCFANLCRIFDCVLFAFPTNFTFLSLFRLLYSRCQLPFSKRTHIKIDYSRNVFKVLWSGKMSDECWIFKIDHFEHEHQSLQKSHSKHALEHDTLRKSDIAVHDVDCKLQSNDDLICWTVTNLVFQAIFRVFSSTLSIVER